MKNKKNKNRNNIITESDFIGAEQFNDYNAPLPDSMSRKKRRKGKSSEPLPMPENTRMPEMQEAERRLQIQRQRQQELEYVRQQELAREQQVREQKRRKSLELERQRQLEAQQQAEQEDEKAGRITVTSIPAQQPEQDSHKDGYDEFREEMFYQQYDDEYDEYDDEYDDKPSFTYLNLKDGKISEAAEDDLDLSDDEQQDQEDEEETERTISQKITPETATVTDIRQERKKQKSRKLIKRLVALGIVAAIGLTAFFTSKYWIPKLEGILDQPHDTIVNDGKAEGGNFPLKVAQSNITSITQCNDIMVTLDVNRVVFYKDNGEQLNTIAHNYSSPVIDVSEKKIVAYDNAGKSFQVMNKKNTIYTKKTDNPILMAKIGPSGYVGVVTQTEKYSAYVTFYDETGAEIYNWASGRRVVDICFTDDGKGCCISTISSSGGKIDSMIYSVDFKDKEPLMTATVTDAIALCAKKMKNGDYWVVCDNKFVKLDSSGKTIASFDNKNELVSFALTSRYAAIYTGSAVGTHGTLMIYDCENESDKANVEKDIQGKPKKLQISDSDIIAFNDKTVECYDSKGNLLSTVNVSENYVDCVYANKAVYLLGYRDINKLRFDT